MKLYYSLLLALLLLTTSSCGFHLRGSQGYSVSGLETISLTDNSAPGVGAEVRSLLEASGTRIAPAGETGVYSLVVSEQYVNKAILSVSAITGKIEEYQLTLSVKMTLTDADQNELLSGQLIRITRDYAFDDEAVLGSVSEQRVLEQEMSRQAASQIVRRLAALTRPDAP
jgi:LPS-assembly lipoprotein